jgi:group I intron endonuclease
LKENKNKAGIYKFTNKLNGNFYIRSSVNLSRRFSSYFNLNYISNIKNKLTIFRALIKYGYFNFKMEILEYCYVSVLLNKE